MKKLLIIALFSAPILAQSTDTKPSIERPALTADRIYKTLGLENAALKVALDQDEEYIGKLKARIAELEAKPCTEAK